MSAKNFFYDDLIVDVVMKRCSFFFRCLSSAIWTFVLKLDTPDRESESEGRPKGKMSKRWVDMWDRPRTRLEVDEALHKYAVHSKM